MFNKNHPGRNDRFRACLLGGAVGDALGAPVEFLSRSEIRQRFGTGGIRAYASAFGGLGVITDDTQMTLFTAEGLLRGWVRGALKGVTTYSGVTAHAYLRWLTTQGESPQIDIASMGDQGWLIGHPALHARRAPGITCLGALKKMQSFGDPARNDSKGCGGVMRMAPAGLFFHDPSDARAWRRSFSIGAELAALTHGHPTGALTGGALAALVNLILDGLSLDDACDQVQSLLADYPRHEETLAAMQLARSLASSGMPVDAAIDRIGQGWIAEEALGIALYCALKAENLRDGVIMAVNHDGDSDSTGAIAGNLLGVMTGTDAIPAEWLASLELREVIEEIADDLASYRDWNLAGDDAIKDRIWKKYPGW